MKTYLYSKYVFVMLFCCSFSLQSHQSTPFHFTAENNITDTSTFLENNPKIVKALELLDAELLKLDLDKDEEKFEAIFAMQFYLKKAIEAEDAKNAMANALGFTTKWLIDKGMVTKDTIEYLLSVYSKINKQIHKISVKGAKGTGQTTGHIADLYVANDGDVPIYFDPQLFYVPSTDRYQSYFARIVEGLGVPPNSIVVIPVQGYCTAHDAPPVPSGIDMIPFEEWIPVSHDPNHYKEILASVEITEPANPPGASDPPAMPEPMNPPGETDEPTVPEPMNPPSGKDEPTVPEPMNPPSGKDEPTVPEPMNPPGGKDEPTVPEPMNPPGGKDEPTVPEPMNPPGGKKPMLTPMDEAPPGSEPYVRLSDRQPLPPFDPVKITVDEPDDDVVIMHDDFVATYPGTSIVIKDKLDPKDDINLFAQVTVAAVLSIEDAVEEIQENTNLKTPWSFDPETEREAAIQNVTWRYFSMLTGIPFERDDFEENLYKQIEDATGEPIHMLSDEEQEELYVGAGKVWILYSATGIEAKVFSSENVDIDTDDPGMMDFLASVKSPACECDSISYDLEVKRGIFVVYSGSHTNRQSPKAEIEDLTYNDELKVKISNIVAHCNCDETVCPFYPPQSENRNRSGYTKTDLTKPGRVSIQMKNDGAGVIGNNGNNNCQNEDAEWNSSGTEYSFTLKTVNEGTKEKSIFQKMTIRSYCEMEDCRRKLCKKKIQLNFVRK